MDKSIWSQFITVQGRNIIALQVLDREQYDEISDAEMEILESTWRSFGWMTASQLRNYTHQNCPEYRVVEKGRLPISYKNLFKALGEPNADELEEEINAYRRVESILGAG